MVGHGRDTPAKGHPIKAAPLVAAGEPPSELKGFFSAISRWLLPSFMPNGKTESVLVMVGISTSSWTSTTMHPMEVHACGTALPAAVVLFNADGQYRPVPAHGRHSRSQAGPAFPGSHQLQSCPLHHSVPAITAAYAGCNSSSMPATQLPSYRFSGPAPLHLPMPAMPLLPIRPSNRHHHMDRLLLTPPLMMVLLHPPDWPDGCCYHAAWQPPHPSLTSVMLLLLSQPSDHRQRVNWLLSYTPHMPVMWHLPDWPYDRR